MKKVIGLVLLLIVLVAVSGCTQQTKTVPATTTEPTVVATTVETPVETTAPAPVETTAEVTTEIPAQTTAAETAAVTTVPNATATVAPSITFSKVNVIHIVNNTFNHSTIMVLPGTGIIWINDDKTVHSVKMVGEHAGKFNSGDIAPSAQWKYDFGDAEGTYQFADGYNLNVTGVVIIKKGDALYGMITSTPHVTSNATW
jgi:plastocyanin